MNCSICMAYLREKNKCPGCRGADIDKPITRINVKSKLAKTFKKVMQNFVTSVENFPAII